NDPPDQLPSPFQLRRPGGGKSSDCVCEAELTARCPWRAQDRLRESSHTATRITSRPVNKYRCADRCGPCRIAREENSRASWRARPWWWLDCPAPLSRGQSPPKRCGRLV